MHVPVLPPFVVSADGLSGWVALALIEAVLLRLARRDVVPFDAVVLGPLEHGVSGDSVAVARRELARRRP